MQTISEAIEEIECEIYDKESGFVDVYNFLIFINRFMKKHFSEMKEDSVIFRLEGYSHAKGIDIRKNLTDYMYIINESGIEITICTKEGKVKEVI